jgi:phosphoglycolate phosphatase
MSVSLLILDLDGTLVDSKDDIAAALNSTLVHFGAPVVDDQLIRQHVGTGIAPLLQARIAPGRLDEARDFFSVQYRAGIAEKTRLYPGWGEFFQRFPKLPKVVLTNKLQGFSDHLIERLNLKDIFAGVFGREAFSEPKPSAVPVLGVCQQFNVPPAECLMVGDTENDVLAGQRAGARTCAVLFGYGESETLRRLRPSWIIERVTELSDLLASEQESNR